VIGSIRTDVTLHMFPRGSDKLTFFFSIFVFAVKSSGDTTGKELCC